MNRADFVPSDDSYPPDLGDEERTPNEYAACFICKRDTYVWGEWTPWSNGQTKRFLGFCQGCWTEQTLGAGAFRQNCLRVLGGIGAPRP